MINWWLFKVQALLQAIVFSMQKGHSREMIFRLGGKEGGGGCEGGTSGILLSEYKVLTHFE